MLDEKISLNRRAKQQRLDNRLSEPMKYAICYIIYEYVILSRILRIQTCANPKLTFVDAGVVRAC